MIHTNIRFKTSIRYLVTIFIEFISQNKYYKTSKANLMNSQCIIGYQYKIQDVYIHYPWIIFIDQFKVQKLQYYYYLT